MMVMVVVDVIAVEVVKKGTENGVRIMYRGNDDGEGANSRVAHRAQRTDWKGRGGELRGTLAWEERLKREDGM